MKDKVFLLFFIGIFCFINNVASAQTTALPENALFARKYKPGDHYRYKLTMQEFHGGKPQFINIAVCELTVVAGPDNVLYDEVHWISKIVITDKDTVNNTPQAIAVKPYLISLGGKGKLNLPKIEVPEMTEPIQDFNTFFVAVSPQLGQIDQLKNMGDTIAMKKPVTADFSNGKTMLIGQDCLDIHVKMVGLNSKTVNLYTAFMPPKQPCLSYLTQDMNTPVVADTLNNFQMVTPSANNLYNILYGREYFYINSTLSRKDGKIIKASMFNKLNLKIKINCDKDNKNCAFETPFSEYRNLTLVIL